MILTHLNLQHSATKAMCARSYVCARNCRRSSPIHFVYWRRSQRGWLGNGNQKPSALRSRTATSDRGSYDQQAEAVTLSPNPISTARSLRTSSSSYPSMQTSSAVDARARHSICTLGESNENSHTLDRKCTSRRRLAGVHATDGRVEPSATTKAPTFDGRRTFGCAVSNVLTGVLSNRVGGLT